MKNPAVLPEGYSERFRVDLAKDRKLFWLVNGLSAGIALILAIAGCAVVSPAALFDMEAGLGPYALRFGVLLVGMIVYIILHEAVHGACMHYFSDAKVHYGFKGAYAFAGSEGYFYKRPYLIIAAGDFYVAWKFWKLPEDILVQDDGSSMRVYGRE